MAENIVQVYFDVDIEHQIVDGAGQDLPLEVSDFETDPGAVQDKIGFDSLAAVQKPTLEHIPSEITRV